MLHYRVNVEDLNECPTNDTFSLSLYLGTASDGEPNHNKQRTKTDGD